MGFISAPFSGKINLNCKVLMARLDSTLSPITFLYICVCACVCVCVTELGNVDGNSRRTICTVKQGKLDPPSGFREFYTGETKYRVFLTSIYSHKKSSSPLLHMSSFK